APGMDQVLAQPAVAVELVLLLPDASRTEDDQLLVGIVRVEGAGLRVETHGARVRARAQDRRGAVEVGDRVDVGGGWQLLSEGHGFTEGPASDKEGNVFFTDIPNNRIHKIDLDGKVSVFAENTAKTNGLMFGPDGRLYGCRN